LLPVRTQLSISDIEDFCRFYPLLTTDIHFNFVIIDNTTATIAKVKTAAHDLRGKRKDKTMGALLNMVLGDQRQQTKIDYPAVHPISTEWNNNCNIHTLMPDEFISLFATLYDKSTIVYERLQSIREGNWIPKSADYAKMTIGDHLMKRTDGLPAPEKLGDCDSHSNQSPMSNKLTKVHYPSIRYVTFCYVTSP